MNSENLKPRCHEFDKEHGEHGHQGNSFHPIILSDWPRETRALESIISRPEQLKLLVEILLRRDNSDRISEVIVLEFKTYMNECCSNDNP